MVSFSPIYRALLDLVLRAAVSPSKSRPCDILANQKGVVESANFETLIMGSKWLDLSEPPTYPEGMIN